MKNIYLLAISVSLAFTSLSQLNAPKSIGQTTAPYWGNVTKTASDSCGTYFNNYIGLSKTTGVRIESMRTGNSIETGEYNGRAARFQAPQPIKISGVEFYAYIKDNAAMDSIPVVTTLNLYSWSSNTLGTELARDTVYVTHHAFNPIFNPIPLISVKSYFDTPVIVGSEYMVSMYTFTDDSLKIIANNPFSNDGNGEGQGYALYDNSTFPTYYGWYDMVLDFSADYDFLLSPLVDFKIENNFSLSDQDVCPGVTDNVCLNYTQLPVFLNQQYHSNYANPLSSINIDWGNTQTNLGTNSICHTYNDGGLYTISLNDTFHRWDNSSPFCTIEMDNIINVKDSLEIDFTFTTIIDGEVAFDSDLIGADSISWDFGDGSSPSDDLNPNHIFANPGTYSVWLYAFNDCMTKSILKTVVVDFVSISVQDKIELSIFPNPANNSFIIDGAKQGSKVIIYSITGEKITEYITNQQNESFLTESFNNGTYFVKILQDEKITTKKLVIRH